MKEEVGEGLKAGNGAWSFAGDTPQHFLDHAKRSIPYYEASHNAIVKISDFFVQDQSIVYELGSATGLLSAKLANHHEHRNQVQFFGIDREQDMIDEARKQHKDLKDIQWLCEDFANLELQKCDLIIAHYSIQFVPPRYRQELFNRIYQSLNWGGALILFEKVRGADARFQDMMTTLYNDYKLEQGYEASEILAKTRSLKGVLEPFSTQGNLDLMKRSGFIDIMTFMKYLCFEGFLAIK